MSAPVLNAWIEGIGVIAPGLPNWPAAAAVLRGEAAYAPAPTVLPAPALLPPAERRRASRVVKLAIGLGLEAVEQGGADAAALTTVFSASTGDGHNCHALCETLASDDRQVSPTRFHNSVHNTAAGYWDIATGAMGPTQVLCAYDAGFGAGLIEALAQLPGSDVPVLLVAYDTEYPEPLHALRPIPDAGGIALLLSPRPGPRALARIAVTLVEDAPASTPMVDPTLDALRRDIPALRGLPLLDLLAKLGRNEGSSGGNAILDYLPPLSLGVEVQPC